MLTRAGRLRHVIALTGAAAVTVGLAGCSGGASQPRPSSPNLSAPSPGPTAPSSAPSDGKEAVVAAYTQFWPRSLDAGNGPEDSWRGALAAIAVDPQLSTTLAAMARQKAAGITTYGQVAVRILSVEVSGSTAKVVDCQDASHAGQADARTGAKKTVGVARMLVHAMLVRDTANGTWKVSKTEFPGGAC